MAYASNLCYPAATRQPDFEGLGRPHASGVLKKRIRARAKGPILKLGSPGLRGKSESQPLSKLT